MHHITPPNIPFCKKLTAEPAQMPTVNWYIWLSEIAVTIKSCHCTAIYLNGKECGKRHLVQGFLDLCI